MMRRVDDEEFAEWLFDPRSEPTPMQRSLRSGLMALDALADQPSAYDATRAIKGMTHDELVGLAVIATINHKRARGTTDDQLSAWLRAERSGPAE